MKKNVFGRKLSRDKNERTALFKALMSSLVLQEGIKTSEAKAKAIRPQIEKLVTKAKMAEKGALLVLEKNLSKLAFDKMVKVIGPRFAKRKGGYTRIIKLGERFGDNSPEVLIEWVEKTEIIVAPAKEKKAKVEKKPADKQQKKTKKIEDKKKPTVKKDNKTK